MIGCSPIGASVGTMSASYRERCIAGEANPSYMDYFGITEVLSPLREIDKWVRLRLRCYAWKQWGSAGCRDTSENAESRVH